MPFRLLSSHHLWWWSLDFLELISKTKEITKRFYWTGGTVLTEFYLGHRLSEDIDLFCTDQEVDQKLVEAFLHKNARALGVKDIQRSQFLGLFSYFLIFNKKETLKVDFSYYPFARIEKGSSYKNIQLDSLRDIAVNKVHTIATKSRARDFIDLYLIIKEKKYNLRELMKDAKIKFDWHIDPLEFGSQLMRVQDLKDYPKMIKSLDKKEWQKFFIDEATKLKDEIIE